MKDFLFTDLISFVGEAPKKFDGYKKYVSTGAVNGNIIESDDIELVDYSSRPSRANLVACSGDILFAKMAETEKTLLLDDETEKNIYSTGFCAIRAKENIIEPKALYYLLGSSLFLNQKNTNSSGATQRAITNTGLSKIRIKLPTMEKQRVFCGIMDKVVDSIELRKKQLGYFDKFTKSLFIEMFGDPSTNPKGWNETTIGNECFYIKDGPHKSLPDIGKENGGHPFISVRNIVNGYIDLSTARYISDEDYNDAIKKCHPEKGDMLYSKGGTTGIAKLIDIDNEFANWVHVAVLKFNKVNLNGIFFENMLNGDYCYKQSQKLTKGIANKDLVLSAISQIKIYRPPIELQNKFANFVRGTDKSKLAVKKSLEELEVLKKSLMQKYFA